MLRFLVLLLAVSTQVRGQGCEPYLVFPGHTMCYYWERACVGYTLIRGGELTCAEKTEILDVHNRHRQSLANGQVPGQPAAASMAEMVWDDELAMIAQRWADQCVYGHDNERSVGRFRCGQNVFQLLRNPSDPDPAPPLAAAVDAWFSEVHSPGFDPAHIDPFVYKGGVRYYTQLAWADSYTLGCGYAMFKEAPGSIKLIVCNYGPQGNGVNQRMYAQGPPDCPAFGLIESTSYPGLCEVAGSNPPGTGCEKLENK